LEDWFIKKMLLIEDYLNEEFCNVGWWADVRNAYMYFDLYDTIKWINFLTNTLHVFLFSPFMLHAHLILLDLIILGERTI
jgi:hypothetical protein